VARTCNDGYILFGNTVYLMKIIGNNQVLVRDDTLDSSDNELVLYFGFQLFQVAFQIGRGGNEYRVSDSFTILLISEEKLMFFISKRTLVR